MVCDPNRAQKMFELRQANAHVFKICTMCDRCSNTPKKGLSSSNCLGSETREQCRSGLFCLIPCTYPFNCHQVPYLKRRSPSTPSNHTNLEEACTCPSSKLFCARWGPSRTMSLCFNLLRSKCSGVVDPTGKCDPIYAFKLQSFESNYKTLKHKKQPLA